MNQSEIQFKNWLDHKQLNFYFVHQNPSSFAEEFRNITKRPDFIVTIPAIGEIAVDVKDFTKSNKEDFIFDEIKEIEKAQSFQQKFRRPYWYAFSCDKIFYKSWFWISLDNILSNIPKRRSSVSGGFFYPINIQEDCRVLGWNDSFGRLLD